MRWKRKSGGESEVTRISSGYWERESFSVFFSICFTCSQTDCRLCGEALTVQQVRDKRGEAEGGPETGEETPCLPGKWESFFPKSSLLPVRPPLPAALQSVFTHVRSQNKTLFETEKGDAPEIFVLTEGNLTRLFLFQRAVGSRRRSRTWRTTSAWAPAPPARC